MFEADLLFFLNYLANLKQGCSKEAKDKDDQPNEASRDSLSSCYPG